MLHDPCALHAKVYLGARLEMHQQLHDRLETILAAIDNPQINQARW